MNLIQLLCCALLTKATTYTKELLPTSQRRFLQIQNPNAALQAVVDELAATGSSICVCEGVDTSIETPAAQEAGRLLRNVRSNWRKKAPTDK
jgi:hypothetical protein